MIKASMLAVGVLLGAFANADINELKMQLQAPRRFDISALFQAESDLRGTEDADHQAGGRITLAPSYRLNQNYRVTLSTALIQDFGIARESQVSNAKVSLSHSPIYLTDDSLLVLSGGGRLPTNENDRRDNTFNGALLFEPNLITQWNVRGFGFSTIYGVYLLKNFHQFDRGNEGKSNMNYQATQYFGVEKYLTRKLYFTLDADYVFAESYQATPKTQFDIGQSLTWEEKKWSLTVGHTNGGNALQANGTDYDVQVFDQNRSMLFATMRVLY